MEREAFYSGYCRQVDNSRMVAVEAEGKLLSQVDCCYTQCPYTGECAIAQKITDFLKAE